MLFTKALLVFSSALAAWALDPTKIKADLSKAKIIPDGKDLISYVTLLSFS